MSKVVCTRLAKADDAKWLMEALTGSSKVA